MFGPRLPLNSSVWLLPAVLALPLAACNMGTQGGAATPLTTAAASGADVVITGQPPSLSAAAGQPVTLSVSAVDTAGRSLSYQWLENNTVISGATGSSYTFTPQAGDSGEHFSVVVTDQTGCLQSLYSSGRPDSDGKRCVVSSGATLTVSSGGVTPVAGGIGGAGNLDGLGSASRFNAPAAVAQDSHGNYYVADAYNELIRKITPAGLVSTYAGKYGVRGHTDGSIADATFNLPAAVVVDSADNLYVADAFNDAIRKITPAGVVSTLAGGNSVNGSCQDGTGSGASFNIPQGIAIDAAGNLYVADSFCPAIRKVTPAGVVTTVSTGIWYEILGVAVTPDGSTVYYDGNDQVYRLDTTTGTSVSVAGGTSGTADGTGAAAQFTSPDGLALDGNGTLYVADSTACNIREVSPTGVVTTLAGPHGCATGMETDGTGSAANFVWPYGILLDHTGNLVVTDIYGETIRKVSLGGVATTFAGLAANIGFSDGSGASASFDFLRGSDLAADSSGNLYVADAQNDLIRKVTPAGVVSTLAGAAQQPGSVDGTGSGARFNLPEGVAVDSAGNVYVADVGVSAIRKISPAGVVTTLAGGNTYGSSDGTGSSASFANPLGVAADAAGNVYVADYGNDTIRKISPAGVVTTLAGQAGVAGAVDGAGAAARFNGPAHLALDAGGNLYVTDSGNSLVRKITPTGVVSTLAGTGQPGSADGIGTAASFDFRVLVTVTLVAPGAGIAVDPAGNVYVADTNNGTIRRITPAGVVSTVAGVAGEIGIQLGGLPSTLGPTQGVVVVGNTLYTTVESASLLSFALP